MIHPVAWGSRIRQQKLRPHSHPPTRPPIGRGWSAVMLESGILVAEQFDDLTAKVVKWPATIHFGPYWARRSERPDPINRLVMSSPSIYLIVPNVFFKLLLEQTSTQPYFILMVLEDIGLGFIALREQYLKPFNWVQTND